MTIFSDSASAGSRIAAIALLATAPFFSLPGSAQTDDAVQAEIINLAIESRFRKPAAQATESERAGVTEEIRNIYAVSDLPRAAELAAEPRLNAQIELQRRVVLFQAFVADYMASNPASEQEIFNEYEEQIALAPPTEYKARHILVETQAAAIDLIEQLNDGGDFQALAAEHSTGPSGPSGGDLGWFQEGAMVAPFSEAVKQLGDGEITSEPVNTQFGWHVILREDSREAPPPPLDSVRDVIKQRIEENKFQDYVRSLRAAESE